MIKTTKISQQLKHTSIFLAVVWTVVIIFALGWNLLWEYDDTLEMAHIQANQSFEKDLVYRRWSANHGGTYVPVTEQTPPNPYLLHVKNRDVMTTSGQELTLVNPAYMTRQVHELGMEQYGHLGHITSLNPIRPENAADDWETTALQSFEQGVTEVGELAKVGGVNYFRLMRPMITEAPCLKCHAHQGYKEGDLRGGISVSVPMEPLRKIMFSHMGTSILGYGLVWLLGLSGIGLGSRNIGKRIHEQETVENDLVDSNLRFTQISDNIEDIFWLGNAEDPNNYRVLYISPAFEKIWQRSVEEFYQNPAIWYESIHEEDKERVLTSFRDFIRGKEDYNTVFRIVRPDKTMRTVALTGNLIRDDNGKIIRVTGITRDITELKQAEEALRESNQLKELLLDIITHDIKNPAGVIRNMAEMMLDEYSDNDMLEIIKYSSDKLLRVMDNATTLAQVTLGDKIKLADIDITEVLHSVGQEFSSQLKQSEMTFKIDLPDKLLIKANPIISEVFSNYISNAIKYANTGKKIIIDTEQNENYLIINVKDFGETIEKDKYDRLFTRKYQIEKGKGRGLGLSIVKKIAEAHNAEVGVKPNEPTGNIFYIRIPEA